MPKKPTYEELEQRVRELEQAESERKQVEALLRENEQKYHRILNNTPAVVFIKDLDGKYLYINHKYEEKHQITNEQIQGLSDFEIFPSPIATQFQKNDQKVLQSGKPQTIEESVIYEDGEHCVLSTKFPLFNDKQKIYALCGITTDITEHKKNLAGIRKSEEKLRMVLDTSPFPIAVVDPADENIVYWSQRAQEMFGHTPETTAEWYRLAYPDPEYREEVIKRWKPLLEEARKSNKALNTGKYRITCQDGSVKICELYAKFIPGNLIVTLHDVTEQIEVKKREAETLERMKLAMAGADEGFWEWDYEKDVVFFSPVALKMLGYEKDFPLHSGEWWINQIHPDDRPVIKADYQAFVEEASSRYNVEFRLKHKDGQYIWVISTAKIIRRDMAGNPLLVIGIHRDITERKKIDEIIQKNEKLLRSYIDNAPYGIFVANENGEFVDVNCAAETITGFSKKELIGMNLSKLNAPQGRALGKASFKSVIKTGRTNANFHYRRKDGSIGYWNVSATKLSKNRFLGFVQDFTDRMKAEQKIVAREKLLRFAVEQNPIPMIIAAAPDVKIQYFNNAAKKLLVQPVDDLKKIPLDAHREFWPTFYPDGAPYKIENLPLTKAIKQGEVTVNEEIVVRHPKKDFWISASAAPLFNDNGEIVSGIVSFPEITEIKEAEKELKKIEWLLEKENFQEKPYHPFYGNIVELNTDRTILDSVGDEVLRLLASDLMDLLDSSVAVYEKNGDYAFGIFHSGWCRLLDSASRRLCRTNDNQIALNCGKWLCHENCWNESAKAAIESGKPTDIVCVGGIKLYAEPIYADDEIVGAINIGYGTPPLDDDSLEKLAKKFHEDIDVMKQAAAAYKPRPPFIVEIAKKRLKTIAILIGSLVNRKQMDDLLKQRMNELEIFNDAAIDRELKINEHRKEINALLKQLGKQPKYEIVT